MPSYKSLGADPPNDGGPSRSRDRREDAPTNAERWYIDPGRSGPICAGALRLRPRWSWLEVAVAELTVRPFLDEAAEVIARREQARIVGELEAAA